MYKIDIKPLSANRAWYGRRFLTSEYKTYKQELHYLLPAIELEEGELKLEMEIGVQGLFDIDNCLKPFIDILQTKYNFNDNKIVELRIKKKKVKKGLEYIKFKIKTNK